MKLENHLYLVKREDGSYIIGWPVYDPIRKNLTFWRQQNGLHIQHSEKTDDIIGSIERIEERKWARQQKAKAYKC